MIYKSMKNNQPQKYISGLFLILSNADKNRARIFFDITPAGEWIFSTRPETRPRLQIRHRERRAQEARQRVFIAFKGSDTGCRRKNAIAARWQVDIDSKKPPR